MPKRKRIQRRGKRRIRRRTGKRSGRRYRKSKRTLIVPNRKFIKLRYIETSTSTLSGGATSTYLNYKVNDAYDVASAVGSTAMPGYAEWSAFYSKYRVHASKVKFTAHNESINPYYMGLFYTVPPTVFATSWGNFMETRGNPHSKVKMLSSSSNTGSKQTITMYRKHAGLFGDKLEYLADQAYAGTVSSHPSSIVYATVWLGSYDGVTNLPAITPFNIEVTLWLEFYSRKYLTS